MENEKKKKEKFLRTDIQHVNSARKYYPHAACCCCVPLISDFSVEASV